MRHDIKASIDRYATKRIPTGDFLKAVLENNLREALGRADDDNLRDIHEIVMYCHNKIPGLCWGSPEKVKKWLRNEEE